MSVITASCPKCFTEYQLQPEQLQVAGGKVRCGECLTVFRAKGDSSRSAFVSNAEEELLSTMASKEFRDYTQTENYQHQEDDSDTGSVLDDESWVQDLLASDDESWAEKLLEEEEQKSGEQQAEEPVDPFEEDLKELDFSVELSDDEEQFIASLSDKGSLRDRIQAEPLELSLGGRRSLWVKLIASVSLVLLIVLLATQFFYFQFNELAKKTPWRSMYASVCQILDCSLPELYSSDAIQATQLTVRSHAKIEGALLVDVVLVNQANLAQPFPNFELFFTDRNNKIVAARSFTPKEYLLGELKGLQLMTARQPMRVSLEIEDPGVDASGYWMQLHYPDKNQ